MQLRREAELTIWHQFSRALARSHWRDMDVILLEKNVQMDANIRAAQIELDAMGMMIKNKRGAPITNPFLLVIDTLERRQRLTIRLMSLNQTDFAPPTVNGTAKVDGEARAAFRHTSVEELIAQPAHYIRCLIAFVKASMVRVKDRTPSGQSIYGILLGIT